MTTALRLPWLHAGRPNEAFPEVATALTEPNGLLAVGGDLSAARLQHAYRQGIFPWYEDGQPLLWWSPDPRWVLTPDRLHVSRSLAKCLRRGHFQFSFDRDFPAVMAACAAPRRDSDGTWITDDMHRAYQTLHRQGMAHSIETWQDNQLVGGLYGVAIGQAFFGESMFHRADNASKAALVFLLGCLARWGYRLVDCQVHTAHLHSLGAYPLPRAEFIQQLRTAVDLSPTPDAWRV